MLTRDLWWPGVLLATLLCVACSEEGTFEHGTPIIHTAVATLEPVADSGVTGSVKLTEATGVSGPKVRDRTTRVTVTVSLDGVERRQRYDVSLHEHGACEGPGAGTEDRFDPGGEEGAGELGRIQATGSTVEEKLAAEHVSVARGTESERSALGKSLVVRTTEGERVACGVIRPQ